MVTQTFTLRETHGRALRSENSLIAHSQDAGWRSLYAAIFEEAPFEATEHAVPHPFFIYHLSHPTQVTRTIEDGPKESTLIEPRRFCLTPGEVRTHWQHSGHPEILQVYLHHSIYSEAVQEMYRCDASSAHLVPQFAVSDPLLEQLAIAISTALRDKSVEDGLYVDTLGQMIGVHLARHYSSCSKRPRIPGAESIAGVKWRQLIDFIEGNLDRDLSLEAMAAEVFVSPLYLPRAFKSAVGESPHRYVLHRRVERARHLLANTEMAIVDIALAAGFSSQSHLSNWFLRLVGVSPAAYRRQVSHRAVVSVKE